MEVPGTQVLRGRGEDWRRSAQPLALNLPGRTTSLDPQHMFNLKHQTSQSQKYSMFNERQRDIRFYRWQLPLSKYIVTYKVYGSLIVHQNCGQNLTLWIFWLTHLLVSNRRQWKKYKIYMGLETLLSKRKVQTHFHPASISSPLKYSLLFKNRISLGKQRIPRMAEEGVEECK